MSHNYVKTTVPIHKMSSKDITRWFQVWGIIGRRRSEPALRPVPIVFDKGPGPVE